MSGDSCHYKSGIHQLAAHRKIYFKAIGGPAINRFNGKSRPLIKTCKQAIILNILKIIPLKDVYKAYSIIIQSRFKYLLPAIINPMKDRIIQVITRGWKWNIITLYRSAIPADG